MISKQRLQLQLSKILGKPVVINVVIRVRPTQHLYIATVMNAEQFSAKQKYIKTYFFQIWPPFVNHGCDIYIYTVTFKVRFDLTVRSPSGQQISIYRFVYIVT